MNKKKKDAPKLRFPDFSDAWEQRKFKDFTFPAGERNKDDLDLEPFAITNNQGFISQKEAHNEFGYMKDADRKMYYIVKPNSFAYNPARINVGSLGYYEGTENVIVSSLYEVFQTVDYVDDKFLKYWFKTNVFQDWIERLQEGSVRLYFYYDKLCECIMCMPSLEEQRKIRAYLDKVDNLITLHQRKLELTKEYKKGMLQKMFPKDGEKVPEVRFPGFTGDWEQRKLKDIASSFEYGLNSAAKEFDGTNKYLRITDIDDSSHAFREDDLTSPAVDLSAVDNYRLQEGDVLFARTGASVGKSFIYRESDGIVYFAGFLIRARIKPEYNAEFVFQNTLTSQYEKYILITSQRSGQPGVNAQEYGEYSFLMPNYKEQEKIGSFLHRIDNLITLHQRKLEAMKEYKKGLLQQMFV